MPCCSRMEIQLAPPSEVVAERRRSPRLRLAGELNGGLLPFAKPVRVIDLSLGGFAVEAPIAFVLGHQYLFEFSSVSRKHRPLKAINVHCLRLAQGTQTVYIAGFKFIAVDRIDQETIGAMLGDVEARSEEHTSELQSLA